LWRLTKVRFGRNSAIFSTDLVLSPEQRLRLFGLFSSWAEEAGSNGTGSKWLRLFSVVCGSCRPSFLQFWPKSALANAWWIGIGQPGCGKLPTHPAWAFPPCSIMPDYRMRRQHLRLSAAVGTETGRVDLGGCPPRPPTDPDVPVKGIRLVTLWRCPSHDPLPCGDTLGGSMPSA